MADNKLYTKERLFLCLDVPEKAQERFKHIKDLSDDLHVTLVYVPDKTISEEDQTKVLDAIAKVAKDYKDLACEFTGIGNFDNGDDTMVALVNIPDGSSLYVALVDAIEGVVGEWEKKYGFIPHCTLKEKGDGESDLEDLKDFKWTAKDIRVTFGDDNISYVALGSGKIEKKSSLTFGSILETPELLNPYPFKAGDTVSMNSRTSHMVYESTILYIGLLGDMPDFHVEQYANNEEEALRLPKDTVVIKYKFGAKGHVWWETLSTFVSYWQSPTVIDKTSSILESIQNIAFTKESSILNSILKPIKGSSAYAFICDKVMNVNAYGRKALGLHPDGVNLDSIVNGLNYVYNAKESNAQEYAINCYIPNITNDLLMTLILDKSEFDTGFVESKEASQLVLEFGEKKASILESVPQEDVANSLDELEQYAKPYQIWRETSKNKHSYLYIADPQIVYKSDINIIFKLAIWHYRITNGNFLLSSISEDMCNAWQRSAPFTLVCDDWRTLPEERVERNASILLSIPPHNNMVHSVQELADIIGPNEIWKTNRNGNQYFVTGPHFNFKLKNTSTDGYFPVDDYTGDFLDTWDADWNMRPIYDGIANGYVVLDRNMPMTFVGHIDEKTSSILDAPELQEANQEYMPGDVYRERVGYINTQYDDNLHYNDLETVEDAIRYEIEELDNVEVANEMKQALRTMGLNDQRIPSNRLLWVWKDSNHAGVMSLDESEVNIERVKIPAGSRVMSDCGGDILLLVPANTRQGNKNRPHPVAVPIRQQLDYPHFTFDKQSSILTAIKDREYYESYLDKIDKFAPEFKVPEEYTGIQEEDTKPQSPQEDIGAYNSIVDAVKSEGNTDPDVLNEELQAAYERRLKGWELYKIHQTYIREAEENKGYDVWRLVEDYADAKRWSIYENDDSGDYANFLVMKQFADKVSYYKVRGYDSRKSIDDWEWETTQNTTIKDWSLDENYWDYEDLFKDENVNKELANQYEDPQDPYRSNPLAYVYEHLSYHGGNNDYTSLTCYDVFTRVLNGMFNDDERLEPFDPKMFVPPSNFPTYKQPADPNQLDLYTGKTEKELFPHRYRFESSLNFEAIQKHGSILDDPQFDEFREPEPPEPEPEPEPEVAWIPLKEAYHEMEVGESWEVKRGDSTAKIWLIREKHLEIVEGGVDKFTFHLIINGQRFIYRTPKANEELYIARQIMQHPAAQLEQGIINFSDWSAYLEGKTYDVNTFWQYAKRGQIWSFIRKGAGQFDGYTVRRYVLITKLEPSKDYVHGYYCYQVAECMERNEITTGSPIEDEWTSIKYETYVNQNG